jgi:MYXO-CTERM domain-containing protein
MMDMGFDFKDNAWSLRFKAVRTPINSFPNNHNLRCVDLNADGIDECVNGGYAIKGDGTVLWNQASQGITHGDRWHIGDLDPTRPGLEGWAIGQRSGYDWNYYDAKTGTVLRKYGPGTADMARGVCGDVDPTHLGYECWTNGKVFNNSDLNTATALSSTPPTQIGSGAPGINFRIFWDGDLLSEVLDSNTVSKWAYPGAPSGGFTSANLAGLVPTRNAAPLYGDMFGDWREEVLFEQSDSASIRIYSTAIPTTKRIYTLMHDPEYRNSMCEKGYQQSHMLDYYLGDGMTDPPKPNIKYPDGTGAAGSGGGGATGAAGAGGGATSASAGANGGGATSEVGGSVNGGATSASAGASGGGATSASAGASGGGTTVLGGETGSGGESSGGVAATSSTGVVGSGGKSGTGGIPAQGGGGAGAIATGGTPAPGGTPGTSGGAAGNPAPGGTTSVIAGGAGAPAAGTTAVAGTSGSASSAAGGTVAGQSSTGPKSVVAGSGCSCGIGGTSGRASAGSLFAMLGLLGLIAHRRRRRVSLRK